MCVVSYPFVLIFIGEECVKSNHGGHWSVKKLEQLTREDGHNSMTPEKGRDVMEKTLRGGVRVGGLDGRRVGGWGFGVGRGEKRKNKHVSRW